MRGQKGWIMSEAKQRLEQVLAAAQDFVGADDAPTLIGGVPLSGPLVVVECGVFTQCSTDSGEQTSLSVREVLASMAAAVDRPSLRKWYPALAGARRHRATARNEVGAVVRVTGAALAVVRRDALWSYCDLECRWIALRLPHLLVVELASEGATDLSLAEALEGLIRAASSARAGWTMGGAKGSNLP